MYFVLVFNMYFSSLLFLV